VLLDQSYCDAVIELEQRCYSHPWSPELIRGEFQKDVSLRVALLAPLTAGSQNEIVAYCFSYLVEDELHILNLAVNPKFRSRGYGKQLLNRLLQYAYRLGARNATLEVRQSNYIAKRLYAGVGFEVLGMRKNYYRDNSEHALVLQCILEKNVVEKSLSEKSMLEKRLLDRETAQRRSSERRNSERYNSERLTRDSRQYNDQFTK